MDDDLHRTVDIESLSLLFVQRLLTTNSLGQDTRHLFSKLNLFEICVQYVSMCFHVTFKYI